ncbi:hypothetical protein Bca52824_021760 [Brassica carinata]|uniref:Uncharacterized protein n=1 Tax=Brassica carinata TaxID=52824 RepID=A0A8X7VEX2_BRACI|nr:hypothetical protein Bca52824_021760 [Brassica carinata]
MPDWVLVLILTRGCDGVLLLSSCGSVRLDEISAVNEARRLCYGDEDTGYDLGINLCMDGLVIRRRSGLVEDALRGKNLGVEPKLYGFVMG